MRMMVTGAAGFIGKHLARALAAEGHTVVALDIVADDELGTISDVVPVVADIRDVDAVADAMTGVDVVFHEAAIASVPASFADPVECMSVNVGGSAVILEQARVAGVRRVVTASTSAVYGDDPTPLKHEGLTPAPRSPYAVSKLAMEQLADVYARQYGLETVALRYFNVYGPGQPAEGGYAAVIPAILKAVRTGQAMPVYGDGEQTRSFIYVGDVVRANVLAATTPVNASEGVVIANLASTEVVSLNALIKNIESILGRSILIDPCPRREGDIRHSAGDTSVARSRLGFAAEVPLQEGLGKLLESAS